MTTATMEEVRTSPIQGYGTPPVVDDLSDLVVITGDRKLIAAIRLAAEGITKEAQREAVDLREQARRRRVEAAQLLAAVRDTILRTEEEARLAAQAVEEVTDEELRRHLQRIASQEQARRRKALEWMETAQGRARSAAEEAEALEAQADQLLNSAEARPEVVAWRQLTAAFMDRIQAARSFHAIRMALEEAERQGLDDKRMHQAAALRKEQLSELGRLTRETVKLWARYAPGGDGMFPGLTHPRTAILAAVGPGTIFEVNRDGRKLAVHTSQDGLVWVRRRAGGPFRMRGARIRRLPERRHPSSALED